MFSKYIHVVDELGSIRRHRIEENGEMAESGQIVIWKAQIKNGDAQSIAYALNQALSIGEGVIQMNLRRLLGVEKRG